MNEEINISAFLQLITGFQYNESDNDYIFNNQKYVLKSVSYEDDSQNRSIYFFVNKNVPTDIKSVKAIGGIPTYDGFNDKKVDAQLRKAIYQKEYFKRVTKQKRQQGREERRQEAQAERERLRAEKKAELQKKKLEPKFAPVKCAYCGVEFIPVAKNQKFHTDECRKSYYSEKQAQRDKESRKSEKTCPVCGTVFIGNPRDTYCSQECFKEAQKGIRKARYERDKANGLYEKGGKYEYKPINPTVEKSSYGRKIEL